MASFLCLTVFVLIVGLPVVIMKPSGNYTITKQWNNQTASDKSRFNFHLELFSSNKNYSQGGMIIRVDAPFYNDPKIPAGTPPGSMDKLWDYEVAEVFLLGEDDRYLEIELGPRGQYLILELHGYRNVTRYPVLIDRYTAKINGSRWNGEAYIPAQLFPPNIRKFNAYAIHGSDEHREYLSLFPTPYGQFENPDFHRLEFFGDYDLKLN